MSTKKLIRAARAYAHAHEAFKAFSAGLDHDEIGGPEWTRFWRTMYEAREELNRLALALPQSRARKKS